MHSRIVATKISTVTIASTIKGRAIAAATHIFGVETQSLKKQITTPTSEAMMTANVPGPTPRMRPT